jgi:D-sedoheptulose 7-phosphate isomerase
VPVDQTELTGRVRRLFQASIDLKHAIMEAHAATVVRMAEAIVCSLLQGGKVLLCGNGGSAADAQHIAAELLVRLQPGHDRQQLPALALAVDTSSLTACSNDYGFEVYFERMTRALGRPGDVLIGISTTGKSENVVRALRAARETGLITIGLLGGSGGPALAECQLAIVAPSSETGRIQESHITIGHALMELVEQMWLDRRI